MDGWSEIADNAPLCASERCNQMGVAAQWRLEKGDVGSSYCSECKSHIEEQDDYARRDAEEAYYLEMHATHR